MTTFTSPLAESLAPNLLSRFCDYVRVDTQSARDRTTCPSTPGQLDLARALVSELADAGCSDAVVDHNGYVTASLPAAGADAGAPAIGLIAHMDTSPDAPGAGVEPLVHRDYDGGVIELPRDGTADASSASANTVIAASASTRGSNGLTWNKKLRKRLEAAAAPAKPIKTPVTASFDPEINTSRTISPRCEPRAMRIAISCVRMAAENAITL